ncbi:MAG: DUF4249 family protein [Bacteroidales bacterium]|nr:DUF4249 family protein [Bacteroidales bacterium]
MAILKYLIYIVLIIQLSSCYTDFNPKSDEKPELCINSLITAGEPIEVRLSHTYHYNLINTDTDLSVNDGIVRIFINDIEVDKDYVPKEGDRIVIYAESPTYGSAMAEVSVPKALCLGNINYKVTEINENNKTISEIGNSEYQLNVDFNLEVEIEIINNDSKVNYFQFYYEGYYPTVNGISRMENFSEEEKIFFHPGNLEYSLENIFQEHIGILDNAISAEISSHYQLFTDKMFSNEKYTLHLLFTAGKYEMQTDFLSRELFDCGVMIHINSISQSLYNYGLYLWNQEESMSANLADFGLADLKWGYSNVSTGAGIVAARTKNKIRIDISDFLREQLP